MHWLNPTGCLRKLIFFTLVPGALLASGPIAEDRLFDSPLSKSDRMVMARITARLSEVPVLRAKFEQEKRIKALRRPLISQGRFLFAMNHGVSWAIEQPFQVTYVLSEKGILQNTAGEEPVMVQASKQPVISGFTRVFLSLFKGDAAALEKHFKLHFQGTEAAWSLGLVPKSGFLAKFIDRIVLQGHQHVERIRITEASGDGTLIQLRELHTVPGQLSEAELAQFSF